jgi:hypothetical protein
MTKCCVGRYILFVCDMAYQGWLKEKPMKKTENIAWNSSTWIETRQNDDYDDDDEDDTFYWNFI